MTNLKSGLIILSLFYGACAMAETVEFKLTQMRDRTGDLYIAVFNNEDSFPKKDPVAKKKVEVTEKKDSLSVTIDLEPGEYAASIYLDENKNGKLDTNLVGMPKEIFGFSNNPKILTGAPSYKKCVIKVSAEQKQFDIKMVKFL